MYTSMLEPEGMKTKEYTLKKKFIRRNTPLTANNLLGLPFKLLLYDHYRRNVLYSFTYDYAKLYWQTSKLCCSCQDTTLKRPPAESGRASRAMYV